MKAGGLPPLFLAVAWRAALLTAAYALFVAVVRPPIFLNLAEAETRNRIAAERFLAFDHVPEAVLLGSSMSRQLEAGLAKEGGTVYDLAFFGGSPLTGGDLALGRKDVPRLVVVEVNNLRQFRNAAFLEAVRSQPGEALRRWCPALRLDYQPVRVLSSQGRIGDSIWKKLDPSRAAEEKGLPFSERLAEGVSHALAPPPPDYEGQIDRSLDLLETQVAALRERGSRVLFLHLPVDPRVAAGPGEAIALREARARFPEEEWLWLDFPADGSFETSDGVHLTALSARAAAKVIDAKVKELLR